MSNHSQTAGFERIKTLDGLRGIAIIMVLVVHFCPDYLMPNRPLEWFKKLLFTGWIGVDLFFVLSGFLITGILRKQRHTTNKVRLFFTRRALRILPLYLSSLILTFLLIPIFVGWGEDPSYDQLREHQFWYWIHCANLIPLLHSFDSMKSDLVALQHFWSLAVEEHFYLVWPLLIWRTKYRGTVMSAIAIILTALAARLFVISSPLESSDPGWFVQSFTRMDALAMGGLLSLIMEKVDRSILRKASLILFPILVAVIGCQFLMAKGLWPGSTFMRGIGLTLLALMFSSLLVISVTATEKSIEHRILSAPILVTFGKYSYGLYVVHGLLIPTLDRLLPEPSLLKFAHNEVLGIFLAITSKTLASFAVALVSWKLIEKPFLLIKDRFHPKTAPGTPVTAGSDSSLGSALNPNQEG